MLTSLGLQLTQASALYIPWLAHPLQFLSALRVHGPSLGVSNICVNVLV